jgi:hypothetical protein
MTLIIDVSCLTETIPTTYWQHSHNQIFTALSENTTGKA